MVHCQLTTNRAIWIGRLIWRTILTALLDLVRFTWLWWHLLLALPDDMARSKGRQSHVFLPDLHSCWLSDATADPVFLSFQGRLETSGSPRIFWDPGTIWNQGGMSNTSYKWVTVIASQWETGFSALRCDSSVVTILGYHINSKIYLCFYVFI